MKHKRVWTDEQRSAAAERMRVTQLKRWTKNPDEAAGQVQETPTVEKVRDPEVQAVLDAMTPERRAKMVSIQAMNMERLGQTVEGRGALARFAERKGGIPTVTEAMGAGKPLLSLEEADKSFDTRTVASTVAEFIPEPPVVRREPILYKAPFRLSGVAGGQMVSELGPCVCGAAKLVWHGICLKVKA
jgi:hypothetical protein